MDLMLVIRGWRGHTARLLVIGKGADQRGLYSICEEKRYRRNTRRQVGHDSGENHTFNAVPKLEKTFRRRSWSSSVSGIHTWARWMIHRSPSGSQSLYIIVCLILEHSTSYFLLNTFLVPKLWGYFTDPIKPIDITGIGNETSRVQPRATSFCKCF